MVPTPAVRLRPKASPYASDAVTTVRGALRRCVFRCPGVATAGPSGKGENVETQIAPWVNWLAAVLSVVAICALWRGVQLHSRRAAGPPRKLTPWESVRVFRRQQIREAVAATRRGRHWSAGGCTSCRACAQGVALRKAAQGRRARAGGR